MVILRPFLTALIAGLLLSGCATDRSFLKGLEFTEEGYVDPQAVAGDYLQGRFAASQQSYSVAADAFDRAATQDQRTYTLTSKAFQYALTAGDMKTARRHAQTLIASPVKEVSASSPLGGFQDLDLPRLTLLASQLSDEEYEAALTALSTPFESPLGASIAHLLKGWVFYVTEGREAAIDHLKDVPEGVYTGFAPFHLALMFDFDDEVNFAEVGYAEALSASGSNTALMAYAGFLERHKSKEEALLFYAKLSEDRGFVRRVGRMGLSRLGAPLEGETKEFRQLAARTPLKVAYTPREAMALVLMDYVWSAYEQVMSRKAAAAEAGFDDLPVNLDIPLALAQIAISIDKNQSAGHYMIGVISGVYGQHKSAANALEHVVPVSWLYNYAVIDRADAYVNMDHSQKAIALLRDYLKQDALAPDVALTLADLLSEQGQYKDATAAATTAIRIANQLASDTTRNDNLWRYYFARGAIALQGDDWPAAEADLRKALDLAPEEPILLNFLGYSYVERGQNVKEAFGMIERALEARPTSGAITDSLGWAHYQLGQYEQAVSYLERAVQLEPGDAVITDHLGDAYWQVGRITEAQFEWRRVLEMDELETELEDNVRKKLKGEVAPAPGAYAKSSPDPHSVQRSMSSEPSTP
ncbi:MAG: tetratricopeptide repeat protein [Pseudomonadota bacterium]